MRWLLILTGLKEDIKLSEPRSNKEIKPPDVGGNTSRQLHDNVTFWFIYLIYLGQSHVDGLTVLASTIYEYRYIEIVEDKVYA